MSIKKQYLKTKPICKVTFKIDAALGNGVPKAHVVGEFNGWSTSTHPMKRLKDGGFTATIDLEKGREYQFRYLLGQQHWENEIEADRQVPTPFGDSHNSVIAL
jgi:1,4-alpha-glucan branching enzyme